jgi:hypothetical protein
MTDKILKSRENRLRRKAEHQGLTLSKCRLRDEDAPGCGLYALLNARGKSVSGAGFTLSLDAVESYLKAKKGEK